MLYVSRVSDGVTWLSFSQNIPFRWALMRCWRCINEFTTSTRELLPPIESYCNSKLIKIVCARTRTHEICINCAAANNWNDEFRWKSTCALVHILMRWHRELIRVALTEFMISFVCCLLWLRCTLASYSARTRFVALWRHNANAILDALSVLSVLCSCKVLRWDDYNIWHHRYTR